MRNRPRPKGPDRPVVGFPNDYPDGTVILRHHHPHAQLVYASAGLMRVETDGGTWIVPPQRAVWMPEGVAHEVTCVGEVRMRTLYILSTAAPWLPARSRVLAVSPLLRELVMAVIALPEDYDPAGPGGRLVAVLLDQLRLGPEEHGLHLPMPADRRLRAVAEALIADPADGRALASFARDAGASARTLARLFQAETGMSFGAWRKHLRLTEALARLAAGESVTTVAYAVGYDSPSAFIAMFRRATGETPRRYLDGNAAPPPR